MIRELSLSYFGQDVSSRYHIYHIEHSAVSREFHTHDYFQICYVDKGRIRHGGEGEPMADLVFGDAFIVPPGFVHRILFPEAGAGVYSLSFSPDLFHPGFSQSHVFHFMNSIRLDCTAEKQRDMRLRVSLDDAQRLTMRALMESLVRESTSPYPAELSCAASLIAAMVAILSQAYFSGAEQSLAVLARYSGAMHECMAYIDRHFMLPLSAAGLARQFAFSQSAFQLLFPQFAGTTLKKYITDRRMEYAALLLSGSDLPVSQISAMTGYPEFSTFYRNFKKAMGLTPSEYRTAKGRTVESSE